MESRVAGPKALNQTAKTKIAYIRTHRGRRPLYVAMPQKEPLRICAGSCRVRCRTVVRCMCIYVRLMNDVDEGATTMNKLTTTLIATMIGTALFIAAGSGMALAQMAQ